MMLGWGAEKKKAEYALQYGERSDHIYFHHAIQLNSALCWSNDEVITDHKKIVPTYSGCSGLLR